LNILPLLDNYSITLPRRSLIIYGCLTLFSFGAGIGAGVAAWVCYDMRAIIETNTVNRIVLESMKADTRDMERQLRITSEQVRAMEQRALEGKL